MAEYGTLSQWAGITKEAYADDLERIPFDDGIIQSMVPFEEGERLGNQYHQPVQLTLEHGVTYNGTSGAAVSLNTAVAGVTADATIQGTEMIVRGRMPYATMSRAAQKGAQAFRRATQLLIETLSDTAHKRNELSILYGQKGLGKVTGNSSGVLSIDSSTWSAGTWVDMEGAVLEAWTGQTATETQHNGDLTISAVDLVNKTITVTGTNSSVVANDWLYFKGARTSTGFSEMLGLAGIFGVTSGTVFGISATNYSRWKGNAASSFGPVSMGKLLAQVANVVNRGFKGDLDLMIPTAAFEVLNSDLAALRRFDSSYSRDTTEAGTEGIVYHHQRGKMMIQSHPLLRDGDMMAFPRRALKRIGSSDIRFGVPGVPQGTGIAGDIWFHLQDVNAVEARCWSDQSIFVERPAHCILFTGVTYV